ncbi:MAG TPA: hypothetical protein VF171_09785 [Trueperaceae bacterium]
MSLRRLAAWLLIIIGVVLVVASIPVPMSWLKVLMVFFGFMLVFSGGVVNVLLGRK